MSQTSSGLAEQGIVMPVGCEAAFIWQPRWEVRRFDIAGVFVGFRPTEFWLRNCRRQRGALYLSAMPSIMASRYSTLRTTTVHSPTRRECLEVPIGLFLYRLVDDVFYLSDRT